MIRGLFASLLLAGCISMGDSAARLRGELIVPTSNPSCFLELLTEGIEIDARPLQAKDFEETFVLPPGVRAYIVEIRCDGVAGIWRSAEIELGGLDAYRRGVDLGAIVIGDEPR